MSQSIVFFASLIGLCVLFWGVFAAFDRWDDYKRRKRGEPLRSEIPTGEHLYRPRPESEFLKAVELLNKMHDENKKMMLIQGYQPKRTEGRSMVPPGDE